MSHGGAIGRLSEFQPEEENVTAYLLRMKHYFKANNVKDELRVSVLITVIGPRVLEVLSDLVSPSEVDSKTYEELSKLLSDHYAPKKLVVAERYTFYSRTQKQGESVSDFVIGIKHLAHSCEFGSFLKDALRDKLISGIANDSIRQKLLSEEKNFDETYALALMLEQAERKSNLFVQHGEISKINVQSQARPSTSANDLGYRPKSGSQSSKTSRFNCGRCGSSEHSGGVCPYSGFKCHQCKQIGHLRKMCRAKKPVAGPQFGKPKWGVNNLQQQEEESDVDQPMLETSLYNVGLGNDIRSDCTVYQVKLKINNVPVVLELDTGCALTICPWEIFEEKFKNSELEPSNVKLVTYSGHNVTVKGMAMVHVSYEGQNLSLPLMVVQLDNKNQPMLLGRNWLSKIKLDWQSIFQSRPSGKIKTESCDKIVSSGKHESNSGVESRPGVEQVKSKYKKVFTGGAGEIKGVKAHIILKEGTVPKFCKARPVPFALRDKVEKELERWVNEGIAYKVTQSEWSTPLVVVGKAEGVRLCADFRLTLNKYIEMEHYPLPQATDIFASLAGNAVFSCLDLSNAYQQLSVAEECQHLLTLATHKGLIRLRRLPFGLSSSPPIFQAAIDTILQGLPGTIAYLDDVLIAARSREEALERLDMVLRRLEEYGIKVNEKKCKFLQNDIEYLGHVISAEGLRPQESNLRALREAPEPSNKDELRAYLGLITYYHNFIPNLSARLSSFYELLKKDATWLWTSNCTKLFQESKTWVLNSSLLVHYDALKPMVLTCDASPRGVGAVLSHLVNGQERPIAFASKSLSPSEKNYSQLHREALALIFGVKKFHKYLYGRKFILQTDHQPLATIFGSKRGVPCVAAARLQRWALILSSYDVEVRYRKAADVSHADGLSRLPLPDIEPVEEEHNYISHVEATVKVINQSTNWVSENPTLSAVDVAKLTDKDPVLSKVRDFILHGWRNDTSPELAIFSRKRDELSVDHNCVVWGSRVVIPQKLQNAVLEVLHEQHPGIVRMKLLARSFVWWQGMEKAIENLVSECHVCQVTRNAAVRVPLQQWPTATFRWQRIHIDYAEDSESKQQLLIVIDSFSKWLEVFIMHSTSSFKTIERLRTLFATYGLPELLVSDNASCFTSHEFRDFLQKNGVKFKLIPPYHPASNGAAERSVQIVKKNLLRQVLDDQNKSKSTTLQHKLDNFLFAYRNTPHTVTGQTPAELFLNWKPRTRLSLLKPNLMATVEDNKRKQKEAADRLRGRDRIFEGGQKVLVKTVRNEKVSWIPGIILEKRGAQTYLVGIQHQSRFCHADHLRSANLVDEEEDRLTGLAAGRKNLVLSSPVISTNSTSPVQESSPPQPPSTSFEEGNVTSTQVQPRAASVSPPQITEMQGSPPPPLLRRSNRTSRKPAKLDL